MGIHLFRDMMGRNVEIGFPPRRIISVVPSQTELLFDLGLEQEVVGITKFCIHPEKWFREKTRVGGTKNLNINTIKLLNPDLIIANKEENTKEQIEELSNLFPVWISDISSLEEALTMIKNVGAITGKREAAIDISKKIERGLTNISVKETKRVAYFIWRNPWMCAGGNTYINSVIEKIGWINVFADRVRYPEIVGDELEKIDIDLLLLSSEPYPFKKEHIAELQKLAPQTKILLVDGEMFSWYGSRLLKAIFYLEGLI